MIEENILTMAMRKRYEVLKEKENKIKNEIAFMDSFLREEGHEGLMVKKIDNDRTPTGIKEIIK